MVKSASVTAPFLVAASAFAAPIDSAEEPLVTDRPDFTEAAVSVGKGHFQIETGLLGIQGRNGQKEFATEALLRYGIARRSEVRLGLPAFNDLRQNGGKTTGFGDIYAGMKFALGPTRSGLDLSLIPAVFLPSGSRAFSSGAVDPEIKICASQGLTPRASLSGMLYASAPTDEDNRRNATLQSTVSLGYSLTTKVASFYELVGTFPRRGGSESLLHVGVTYQPTRNTQWDLHFGSGLNRSAPASFLAGGYSVRF